MFFGGVLWRVFYCALRRGPPYNRDPAVCRRCIRRQPFCHDSARMCVSQGKGTVYFGTAPPQGDGRAKGELQKTRPGPCDLRRMGAGTNVGIKAAAPRKTVLSRGRKRQCSKKSPPLSGDYYAACHTAAQEACFSGKNEQRRSVRPEYQKQIRVSENHKSSVSRGGNNRRKTANYKNSS